MKRRLRDYGFAVGHLPTGRWNAITDVPDVAVGHVTLLEGSGDEHHICTGVTAITPHSSLWFDEKCVATSHVINGFGKTTGLVQVEELGILESPILLTNTWGVPAVTEGALQYMLKRDAEIGESKGSLNVVVGECNDSYLNDMRGLHVRPHHAELAIESAVSGPVKEGSVGAGTGMRCFGWKGGIGTSSRQLVYEGKTYHVGLLVLTNFGAAEDLTMLGVPVGRRLCNPDDYPLDGSIMLVLATDLPVDTRQLRRLAKRTAFGLAKTGSIAHHGSGDVVIAFTTANRITYASRVVEPVSLIRDETALSHAFRAVVEATEEAILNSLCAADTTRGKWGRVVPALPMQLVAEWLRG